MIVNTNISWGYLELLKTFFKANELDIICKERSAPAGTLTTLSYDDNSDTAYKITFMSIRHLGFENMLCDYLIRCDIPARLISTGTLSIKRDMKKLDEEWNEYRKTIGLR